MIHVVNVQSELELFFYLEFPVHILMFKVGISVKKTFFSYFGGCCAVIHASGLQGFFLVCILCFLFGLILNNSNIKSYFSIFKCIFVLETGHFSKNCFYTFFKAQLTSLNYR